MESAFEKWLGTETCEVHYDNSAERNAEYGWDAALEEAAKIADEHGGVGGMSDRLCDRLAKLIRELKEQK